MVDVTNNPSSHVDKIVLCKPAKRMQIITNGGSMRYHQEADLKLLPLKVHFNKLSMATIISLALVLELDGHYATIDSREELAILVYKLDEKMLKFKQCKDGLYYFDTARADLHVFNYSNDVLSNYSKFSFIQPVNSNKQFLTKNEIQGAEDTWQEQKIIG